MLTQEELVKRAVARGVDLLDREGPVEWYNHVDLNSLYLDDSGLCILAHLYQYGAQTDTIGEDFNSFLIEYGWSLSEAADAGFYAWSDATDEDLRDYGTPWDALTKEWIRVIRERRGEE